MSKFNAENVMKYLDLKKIEEESKNGKSIEEILREIDLRPIIKEEMEKTNSSVTDEEVDKIVKEIDLVKVLQCILTNEKVAGQSYDELSEEEMRLLQGAGDVEGELSPTPAITTSSSPCLAAISAVSGGVLSLAKC